MAKVTIGFKCDPSMKDDLWNEAVSSGITLSEYVENICANRWRTDKEQSDDTEELDAANAALEDVRSLLYEYEDIMLGSLYQRFRGQMLDMKMPNGSIVKKTINKPIDVLEVILSSLKPHP